MPVPVVTRESRAGLDQSLPHLQRDPEKDSDTMFHEVFSFDDPQFMKPLYVTKSVALCMDESTEDSQQQERLTTSRPEVETFAEGAYVLKHENDALGPVQTLLPLEEEVTECAELSFSDAEGGEEETRDPEAGLQLGTCLHLQFLQSTELTWYLPALKYVLPVYAGSGLLKQGCYGGISCHRWNSVVVWVVCVYLLPTSC